MLKLVLNKKLTNAKKVQEKFTSHENEELLSACPFLLGVATTVVPDKT